MISKGVDIVMSSGRGGTTFPSDPLTNKINIDSHLSLPVNVARNLGAAFPNTRAISSWNQLRPSCTTFIIIVHSLLVVVVSQVRLNQVLMNTSPAHPRWCMMSRYRRASRILRRTRHHLSLLSST